MFSIILYIFRIIPTSPDSFTIHMEQGFKYKDRGHIQLITTLHLVFQWKIGLQALTYTHCDASQNKVSINVVQAGLNSFCD